jgi:predicted O-linked N-acetylglucosamine transferase (SPINDLY family)
VAAAFDTFVDARAWRDADLVAWIRKSEVDILVDLAGHTQGGRPGVLAARAAPVQVTYLGFPGTTGIPAVDYVIADHFVAPPGRDAGYSERVVRLPDCFQANDDRRWQPPVVPSRSVVGLPDRGFVFCAFNNPYKLNPETFEVWMRLLAAVPASILWLIADQPGVPATLRQEAGKRGVAGDRLVFANRVPYPDHLVRLAAADLFLDTLPFNAGTTASDVLWAGLPLVTCAGRSFAARMAGSLLRAIGLPELVTESLGDYEALALRLARSPDALTDIRSRLVRNRATAALFDTARFCRNLESAYVAMWERAEAGRPAEALAVSPG